MRHIPDVPVMGQIPERAPVLGVAGTGAEAKAVRADTQIFYVDAGHATANDNNEGLDPQFPLATIQGLIDRTVAGITYPLLQNYDTIYVSGDVEEDVETGDYTEMPSYINLIGVGP